MKNFKEMLDKDLDSTFYNTDEYAQLKRIRCDGIDKNLDRQRPFQNYKCPKRVQRVNHRLREV